MRKKHYICVRIVSNKGHKRVIMKEVQKPKNHALIEKMLEDKLAINNCIASGGDFKALAKKRNVRFAAPIQN